MKSTSFHPVTLSHVIWCNIVVPALITYYCHVTLFWYWRHDSSQLHDTTIPIIQKFTISNCLMFIWTYEADRYGLQQEFLLEMSHDLRLGLLLLHPGFYYYKHTSSWLVYKLVNKSMKNSPRRQLSVSVSLCFPYSLISVSYMYPHETRSCL